MILELRCADQEHGHDYANAQYNTMKRRLILYYSSVRTGGKEIVALQPNLKGIPYEDVELIDLDWDIRYEMKRDAFEKYIPESPMDKIIIPTEGMKRTR